MIYLSRWVPVSNGQAYALVWSMDYELVSQYTWRLKQDDRTAYAQRHVRDADGNWTTTQQMEYLIVGRTGIDHKNRNGLDNRRSNLRPANAFQQAANRRKKANNTSGYIGVTWNKVRGEWQARVMVRCRTVWERRFDDLEEAAHARDAVALEHHGEFAVVNFRDTRVTVR